jgi:hypothetical protein
VRRRQLDVSRTHRAIVHGAAPNQLYAKEMIMQSKNEKLLQQVSTMKTAREWSFARGLYLGLETERKLENWAMSLPGITKDLQVVRMKTDGHCARLFAESDLDEVWKCLGNHLMRASKQPSDSNDATDVEEGPGKLPLFTTTEHYCDVRRVRSADEARYLDDLAAVVCDDIEGTRYFEYLILEDRSVIEQKRIFPVWLLDHLSGYRPIKTRDDLPSWMR